MFNDAIETMSSQILEYLGNLKYNNIDHYRAEQHIGGKGDVKGEYRREGESREDVSSRERKIFFSLAGARHSHDSSRERKGYL